MYCKLLDEVVKEEQGMEPREEQDIQIDLNVSSYIPSEFIENSTQKIEIYQNISLCKTEEDIQNIIDDIIDRYGRLPEQIENLVEIIRIKQLCSQSFVTKVAQKNQNILFYFDAKRFNMELVDNLIKIYKNRIKFSPTQEPYITYMVQYKNQRDIIKQTKEFLRNIRKES